MGHEISYCAKCAIRILSSDIEKGNAFRIGNQTVCKACAPQVASGVTADDIQLASRKTPRGGTPLPAYTPREPIPAITPRGGTRHLDSGPSTKTRRAVAGAAPSPSRFKLLLGLGLAGVVVVTVVVVLSLKGSPPAAPVPPAREERTVPRDEKPRERDARLAWERAGRYAKDHPDDLQGMVRAYEEVLRAADGTSYWQLARDARDALSLRLMGGISRDFAVLAGKAKPLEEKEEFKAALELFRQARGQWETPDWGALIDGKVEEINKSVGQLLESIKERAVEDKRWGAGEAIRKARERVARWGLAEPAAALDALLNGVQELRPPVQGLVGWWRMDEGKGKDLEDFSGQGHKGTLGETVTWEKGVWGKALSFDGGEGHVRIHPFFESVRNTFTIALWAFPRGALSVTAEGNTGAAELRGHRFAVFPTHGKHFGPGQVGSGLSIGTNGIGVFEHADAHFPAPLVHAAAIQGWTHVALVYSDREPALYVDGKRVKGGMKSTMEVHPSCELGGGAGRYGSYDGLLDDVRIYDRALGEAEVLALVPLTQRPAPPPDRAQQPPPPPPEGGWRAIFDGKTYACLRVQCRPGWIVEQGGMTRTGPSNAAQTVEEFDDGEIRVRFEVEGPESLSFYIRQGGEGKHYVKLDSTSSVEALVGKPHEIVFNCKGASVAATLDGNPLTVKSEGNPRKGCLQFNGMGKVIRILSIEFRGLK